MKKRLMSILISAIMILTSLVPITSSAEETVNIFETYTFEEFLALSEEEICAISDDIAKEYTIRRDEVIKKLSYESMKFIPAFEIIIPNEYMNLIDEYYDTYGDLEGDKYLCSEFELDFLTINSYSFIPCSLDGEIAFYVLYCDILMEDFEDTFSEEDLAAKAAIWLSQNPNVGNIYFNYGASQNIITDITLGDVDQNRLIDTTDATNVLSYYANIAAGISAADYNIAKYAAADIDKNGTVDINDATAILTYYAQKAAGLEPTWEAVLAP